MGKLTDLQIQAWIKLGEPVIGKTDGDGLTFTLSKAGQATWVLRYRFGGKGREYTIGSYPDISLANARKLASTLRAQIDTGVDIAAAKRKAKLELRLATSFRDVCDTYINIATENLKPSTREEIRRYLDKDILPRIGNLNAKDVLEAEVISLIERVAERSQSVARRTFEILSVIMSFAVAKHIMPRNPCVSLKISALIGQTRTRRQRIMLSEDEIKVVLLNSTALGNENALMLKILLATCTRKGELIRAKWEDIELEQGIWHIPAENAKNAKPFDIPLAPTVAGWFRELKALAGKSLFVMPARKNGYGKKAETISRSTLNAALDRVDLGARKFTPHDLRSTARSYLVKQGMSLIAAERCLNHSLGGLVEVYDRYDYFDERKRGLELWATFLESSCNA